MADCNHGNDRDFQGRHAVGMPTHTAAWGNGMAYLYGRKLPGVLGTGEKCQEEGGVTAHCSHGNGLDYPPLVILSGTTKRHLNDVEGLPGWESLTPYLQCLCTP